MDETTGMPSEVTGRRPDDVAALRGAVLRLAARMRSQRPPDSLSPTKVAVLARLYRVGPSTPSDLAAANHQQLQSLTRIFAELQQAGLLAREQSHTDRRASILSITDEGASALRRDMALRDAWLTKALSERSQTEIGVLALAARLLDVLADAEP